MLRCSKCGTINVDGNSFCSSCGTRLARTSIRCPKCGTSNRVGNIFCDKCQTKLISPDVVIPPEESDTTITTVKGISLPTRASTDEVPVMPDWLQQLTDNVRIESFEEVTEDDNTAFASDDQAPSELPDWLSELVELDGIAPNNVVEIDSHADDTSIAQDLPDWLLARQDSVPQSEQKPASSSLQTYETELDNQDTSSRRQAGDTSTEDLPDWLSGIADQVDDPVLATSSEYDIPEWLTTVDDVVDASDTQTDQPMMDWLKPVLETEPDELTASTAVDMQTGSEPDWISDHTEDVDKPKWLLDPKKLKAPTIDLDAPDIAVTEAHSTARAETDIDLTPDWLSIKVSDTDVEDNQGSGQDAPSDTGVLDWLDELGEASFGAEQATTPQLPPQSVTPNEGLPSWLSELNVPQGEAEDSQSVFTPESAAALSAEIQEPDTPAWLDEVSPSPEIIAIQPAAPAFMPSEEEPSLQTGQIIDQDKADEQAFPSWLNELRLSEPGAVTGDTIIGADYAGPAGDFPASDGGLPSAYTDDLVRADLPEWLHDLKPPEGSTWTPFAALSTKEAVEAGNLSPADVPDWVQTLRPKPGEQRETLSDDVLPPEPAEIDGPLASLVGILPATAAVDMPADYEVNLVQIPESVVRQAQLWQQLLGQPRSAVRKVAHPEAQRSFSLTLVRIIVAGIFILGSLAALWLLPSRNLVATSLMENTPGLQMFVTSIDSLQPGETVIVAIEYGWAQAEEMTVIAQAVLNHLADQEVNVMAVSTMPEGTAVIPHLLESTELSNVVSGGASYLSSSASGIARFLKEPEVQSTSMLIVLSSHYERLRWWIEQNQIAASAAGNMPLLLNAALSASIGPLAAPYIDEHNTQGWMIGFQDSLNYQALRGIQNPEQAHILGALMVMHWAAIILLIIGFLYSLISSKKGVT